MADGPSVLSARRCLLLRKEVNRLDVFVFVVRLATAVVGLLREAVAFSETLRRGRNRKDR